MKELKMICLFLAVPAILLAQEVDIVAVKYAGTIVSEHLHAHLEILASDDYQGRETGEEGQKKAAKYIRSFFVEQNIDELSSGGYYQPFPLIQQGRKGINVSVDGKELKMLSEFYPSPAILNNGSVESELVFAGFGIKDSLRNDYEGLEVRDKSILILDGNPLKGNHHWKRGEKIKTARSLGVKSVFVVDEKLDQYQNFIRHYLDGKTTKINDEKVIETQPSFVVHASVAEDLFDSKIKKINKKSSVKKGRMIGQSLGKIEITVSREKREITGENVLGYIEGGDKKEELIVLTAHYDHLGVKGGDVFNGADDDGSGTVALLEIAQAFSLAKRNGYGPRRSVLIMTVAGEEKGLLGSRYYTEHPVFPLKNTVANLNIDMIGRHDDQHTEKDDYIYIIGSDRLSKGLHIANEEANELYTQLDLDYTFNAEDDPNRFYYRSDHYNFAKNNVPVIFYFSGVHEDYHKSTDTIEKIDFEKLTERTKLVFHTAWRLANDEDRIQLDHPAVRN